ARQAQEDTLAARALCALAKLESLRGDFIASRALCDRSIALLGHDMSSSDHLAIWLQRLHMWVCTPAQHPQARELGQRMLEQAEALQDETLAATIEMQLGYLAFLQEGGTDANLTLARQCVRRSLRGRSRRLQSLAALLEAFVLMEKESYPEAVEVLEVSLKGVHALGEHLYASRLHTLLARAKRHLGDVGTAEAHVAQSFALMERSGDTEGRAMALVEVSHLARVQQQHTRATQALAEAMVCAEQIQEPYILGLVQACQRHAMGSSTGRPQLLIELHGSWFELDGQRVDLARRGPIRRLLVGMGHHHNRSPGVPLDTDHLFELGWPGDCIDPYAATRRVYSAIWTMRELGLKPILETRDGGYLIQPGAEVAFHEP
ncbi:MAG: hypothetical protein AAFX99_36590, partial [Myxococcota bacterium]